MWRNRDIFDSRWQTDGGLPCWHRCPLGMISLLRRFAYLRVGRATPIRAVACWCLRRSTTAAHAVTRRGSAVPSVRHLRGVSRAGPIPAVHGAVRWRLLDLAQWLWEEFRVSISRQTLSRELRAMGFRKLSARPRHHAQNEHAIAAFKKLPRPRGGHRARQGRRRANRDRVPRRSPRRPKEQDHPALGQTRHPAPCTA